MFKHWIRWSLYLPTICTCHKFFVAEKRILFFNIFLKHAYKCLDGSQRIGEPLVLSYQAEPAHDMRRAIAHWFRLNQAEPAWQSPWAESNWNWGFLEIDFLEFQLWIFSSCAYWKKLLKSVSKLSSFSFVVNSNLCLLIEITLERNKNWWVVSCFYRIRRKKKHIELFFCSFKFDIFLVDDGIRALVDLIQSLVHWSNLQSSIALFFLFHQSNERLKPESNYFYLLTA